MGRGFRANTRAREGPPRASFVPLLAVVVGAAYLAAIYAVQAAADVYPPPAPRRSPLQPVSQATVSLPPAFSPAAAPGSRTGGSSASTSTRSKPVRRSLSPFGLTDAELDPPRDRPLA